MTPNEIAVALHAEAQELGCMSHDQTIPHEKRCLLARAAGRLDSDVERMRRIVAHDCEPWFDSSAFKDCCPKCGGETYTAKYGPECSAGCDTSILTCSECGWQGDPE